MFHKKSAVKHKPNPTKHRDSQPADKSMHSTHCCSCLLPTKQLADEEREGGTILSETLESSVHFRDTQETQGPNERYSKPYIHEEDLGIIHQEGQVLHW